MERIKEILQKVNKDLAEEKKELSSLKVSLSQSFSQIENELCEADIKERAVNLVASQKRLLRAFQIQKSITEKSKEKSLKKNSTIER